MLNTLQDKFDRFHANNPQVYDLYKRFANECIASGMTTLSISLITERVRWEAKVVTKCDDGFKINNNHRAFYARMLNEEVEYGGMFPTRLQKIT